MKLRFGEGKWKWLFKIKYMVLLNENTYCSIEYYPLRTMRSSILCR